MFAGIFKYDTMKKTAGGIRMEDAFYRGGTDLPALERTYKAVGFLTGLGCDVF